MAAPVTVTMPTPVGASFFGALLRNGKLDTFTKLGPLEHLFEASELGLLTAVKDHLSAFGKLPAVETVEKNLGVTLTKTNEPTAYWHKRLKDRYIKREIKKATDAAQILLQKGPDQASAALDSMLAIVSAAAFRREAASVVDFRDAFDVVWPNYVAAVKGGHDHGIRFGWPTLDMMTGGFVGGDLISIVGRPGMGKTWLMLYIALHCWLNGKKPMFVSMEMVPSLIMERLSAMYTQTALSKIKLQHNMQLIAKPLKGQKAEEAEFKEKLQQLKLKTLPFPIINGSLTATVEDVAMYTRVHKPDIVLIDGAYLMGHKSKLDRWMRVAENCDLLKKVLATDINVPVVASWQFKRDMSTSKAKGKQKKDGEVQVPDLDDIGYSDAIGQHSSAVMGLLESDGIENQVRRMVHIMKGRSGEAGRFWVNWDFKGMNFSETTEFGTFGIGHNGGPVLNNLG